MTYVRRPLDKTRRGHFFLDRRFYEEDVESVQLIMSHLVPYRVEFLFNENAFEFYGYSALFDELADGALPPLYEFTFEQLKTKVKLRARKDTTSHISGRR